MTQEQKKENMIREAVTIMQSVSFYELRINKSLALLEEAINNKLDKDIDRYEKQTEHLIAKLVAINDDMDAFMVKYRVKGYEKEKLLSHSQ